MEATKFRLSRGNAAALVRPRLFYGWWIVAASVVMLTLSSGIGFYGLGVFLPSLERAFQAGPALVSLGATIFFLVFGLAGPFVGQRIDRLGPRVVTVAGSAIFGAGFIGLALSQTLWQTYVAYTVIAVGFSATSMITVSALVSTWFRARRGLAMSIAMTGVSIGGVVMVPLATRLVVVYGWRTAAVVLALVIWIIGIPLSALVIRRPSDVGLQPDGAGVPPGPTAHPSLPRDGIAWTLASARRTLAFWAVAIAYLLISVAQTGVLSHQIRFLTHGTAEQGAMSLQAAAFVVSMTALASIVGRLALGAVVDRLNRRWVAAGLILLQAIATAGLLLARGNLALISLAVLGFGLAMGSVLMLQALLVSDLFGVTAFGAIYGATMLLASVGMAAGPWAAGVLVARFGTYDVAFGVFTAIGLLAALTVALARPPQQVAGSR